MRHDYNEKKKKNTWLISVVICFFFVLSVLLRSMDSIILHSRHNISSVTRRNISLFLLSKKSSATYLLVQEISSWLLSVYISVAWSSSELISIHMHLSVFLAFLSEFVDRPFLNQRSIASSVAPSWTLLAFLVHFACPRRKKNSLRKKLNSQSLATAPKWNFELKRSACGCYMMMKHDLLSHCKLWNALP